jgi:hypothetical protein
VTSTLLAAPGFAAVDCSQEAGEKLEKHNLPAVGYWMQAVDNDRLTYTSVGGVSSYMYNFRTARPEPIRGGMDAFPIAPGDLYVQPYSGYSFYKISGGSNASPEFEDTDSFGVYQSIGLLPGTTGPEHRKVRIAAGWAAGLFQDYIIDLAPSGAYSFSKVHQGPVQVCRNLPSSGLDSEIPVLSRDGLMISGRDHSDQLTKIYNIAQPTAGRAPTADCTLVQTIPLQTSKISFSFDNQKAMFVMDDPNTNNGRLVEMDIATGLLTTLSLPNEDVMYMTYRYDGPNIRKDNAIIYSRRVATASTAEVIILKPGSVASEAHPQALRLEALGHMWGKACNMEFDTDYARAVGSRVVKSMCADLVTDAAIADLPEEYRSLSRGELEKLCSKDLRGQTPETVPSALY